MKAITKVFNFISIFFFIFLSQVMPAMASDNALLLYEERLNEINAELGTNYEFVYSGGEISEDEMISFYTSMTIDEFDAYIRNMANKGKMLEKRITFQQEEMVSIIEVTRATDVEQRYYYDGVHYLKIYANTNTEHGKQIYSKITKWGHSGNLGQYPYYSPRDLSCTISSDGREVECIYTCNQYVGPNIMSAVDTIITVTFVAGGGNIYPIA